MPDATPRQLLRGWLDYEATVDDVIDAGDNVVVILYERARVRGSDATSSSTCRRS